MSVQTSDAVLLLRSSRPYLNRAPSLVAVSVAFHVRINRNFRSQEMCDLYPKNGTARSVVGSVPSPVWGFAFVTFCVQRTSRSLCESFSCLSFLSSGIRSSRKSAFFPLVSRCFRAATGAASRICPDTTSADARHPAGFYQND